MIILPRRLVVYLGASFLVGMAVGFAAPWLIARAADRVFPLQLKEIARVTSPDGRVDAVIVRDNCGAPCSYGYTVFVLPNGESTPHDFERAVFSADDMLDEKLVWKQPHLLAISYSRALIYKFRNVAYPFGEFGASQRNWDYRVEIQLAPSSVRFSYLRDSDLR
jgi:hypothetical protein